MSVRRLACLALVLAGCVTDPVTGQSKFGLPTSDAREQEMGAAYRPAIVQQFSGPYPDRDAQDYLGSIVLGMAHTCVRPELDWHFTILNTSTPNAFALPGGQVFITRGLLALLDDEAQFAVIMGHEIGHVEHRHSIQSMPRDQLLTALGQFAGKKIGSAELAGTGVMLVSTRFSRDQERESDERGVANSLRAGYDPRRGADVFRKLLELKTRSGGSESVLDAWTSSHPLDSERIETIRRLSGEADRRLVGDAPVAELRTRTGRFDAVAARIRNAEKVYVRHDGAVARALKAGGGADAVKAAIPELEACVRALPDHAVLANTLAKAYYVTGDTAGAQRLFQRAADANQELLEPEFGLATIALASKEWKSAASHADRGLAILPENYLCLYVRGEANWNLGDQAAARADLEKVVASAPDTDEGRSAAARLGVAPQGRRKAR
jgi:predicted Zn-dependent protease